MRAWIAGIPGIVLSTLVPVTAAWAQSSATVPSNYKGPTVVGYCFYVMSETVNYAGPITISNYFRFDAERAFRQYATTQAKGAPLQGTTCRWVTEEQAKTAKDQGFHATDKAGKPVKAVQTGWHYTPGSGGMNGTANAANTAATNTTNTTTTAAQRNAARNATATNGNALNTSVASSATANQGTTATNPTGATGSGAGSISQSVNDSKQAITSSGASAVTDTMSTATSSVTSAMQNGMGKLFHKKQAAQTAAAPGDAASGNTAGATGAPAGASPHANQVAANQVAAEAPGAVTVPVGVAATTGAPAAGGVNFVFCHLKAGGSAYFSDVFPSSDASQAGAEMAFWRQVGHQYKIASIPYRDNVACVSSAGEPQATTARQGLMDGQHGTSSGKTVDTGWTYMGDGAK